MLQGSELNVVVEELGLRPGSALAREQCVEVAQVLGVANELLSRLNILHALVMGAVGNETDGP